MWLRLHLWLLGLRLLGLLMDRPLPSLRLLSRLLNRLLLNLRMLGWLLNRLCMWRISCLLETLRLLYLGLERWRQSQRVLGLLGLYRGRRGPLLLLSNLLSRL